MLILGCFAARLSFGQRRSSADRAQNDDAVLTQAAHTWAAIHHHPKLEQEPRGIPSATPSSPRRIPRVLHNSAIGLTLAVSGRGERIRASGPLHRDVSQPLAIAYTPP